MFVIGVAGQLQNGKDTLADCLMAGLNKGRAGQLWKRTAFAHAVKKIYADTFGVDFDFIERWKVIPEPPPGFAMSVRQSLQFIGDGFRKIHPTIWIDLVFRNKTVPTVVSDVRYVNEFCRVADEGGMNILVARPEKLNKDPNGSEAQIRPYVDYCLATFSEPFTDLSRIDWTHARAKSPGEIPPDIEKIHLFVRNDRDMAHLKEVTEKRVLPFALKYDFKFP